MLNSKPDMKNVGLLLILADLKSNLDIYEIITANIEEIQLRGAGKSFFNFIRHQSFQGIAIGIGKIYEIERTRYPLNSLDGVIKSMLDHEKKSRLPSEKVKIIKGVETDCLTIRVKFKNEIDLLKTYRDKVVAHSEFEPDLEPLPSFDALTDLYNFAYHVYALFAKEVVGVHPRPPEIDTKPRVALIQVLSKFGISEVRKELT